MAIPHAQTIPSVHTFLQYDLPIQMEPDEPDPPREKSLEWLKFWLFRTSDMRFIPDPRLVDYVAEYKKCQRKITPSVKDTKNFLESLFPTKYWTDNGVRYKQTVSMEQATRPFLNQLNNKLDSEIERRQAIRKINEQVPVYCPIRYTLHMELFDELIRQVTLGCRFRGYMLNRVRGELYQTLDAYKALLSTSIVEDSRSSGTGEDEDEGEVADYVDPEFLSLRRKVATLESELSVVQTERFYVGCDYKEVSDKMDLLDRIQTQLYQPEVDFLNKIQHAMQRQLFHFENPPALEEAELEDMINI